MLDVSRPAFPIPTGFPSPDCMNRPHSRVRSHVPGQGCSLPVWLGLTAWLLGLRTPCITQLWTDSSSQLNILHLKVTSWEEPAALVRLIFSFSGWHKPHHYWCSFYLQTLKTWNFSLITQYLCSLVLQCMKFFFDEADGSLCPPLCLLYLDTWFFHLYLW